MNWMSIGVCVLFSVHNVQGQRPIAEVISQSSPGQLNQLLGAPQAGGVTNEGFSSSIPGGNVPQCNNVDIALHIKYVSDLSAVYKNMTAFDEARLIRRTMQVLHKGHWGAMVISNKFAAGRTVLWTLPGENYCNMPYRGWYYTVWRVDRIDVPWHEFGLHTISQTSRIQFGQEISNGAIMQAG